MRDGSRLNTYSPPKKKRVQRIEEKIGDMIDTRYNELNADLAEFRLKYSAHGQDVELVDAKAAETKFKLEGKLDANLVLKNRALDMGETDLLKEIENMTVDEA